ncbi:MAG: hypothetical protein QMD71_07550 [bacterium]|nr:hypothetical protein [bacterium]
MKKCKMILRGLKRLFLFLLIIKGSAFSQGINWHCATYSAAWHPRDIHASIAFDNRMWVMGGFYSENNQGHALNDVWYSIDGVTWVQATDSAAWPAMNGPPVVFDNKMWVILGPMVYYSTDGTNWNLATVAPYLPRVAHSTVVFDGKIWVTGGVWPSIPIYFSDVWNSTDGINWVCVVDSAAWGPRCGHISVAFDNKMWVLGGGDATSVYLNDVWYSEIEGIAEREIISMGAYLVILPTIAKEYVKIKYKSSDRGDIKIYNMAGCIVKNLSICKGRNEINWDLRDNHGKKLCCGIYFIYLETKNMKKSAKLVVM